MSHFRALEGQNGDRAPWELALDFLSTPGRYDGNGADLLQTPQDLLGWLREHVGTTAVGPERRSSPPEARALQDEARRLRAAIGALVEAHHRRRALPEWALFGVNRVLAADLWSWRLADAKEGMVLEASPAGSGPFALLGPVALAAARLVTSVPPDRLRRCASPRCGVWFVDTSKGGRRRWCSMARCGNREKAATHRAKAARG